MWCRCATFWLYTVFMNYVKEVYDQVLEYCIAQIENNHSLALFDKKTFEDFKLFAESVPIVNDSLVQCFKSVISKVKPG